MCLLYTRIVSTDNVTVMMCYVVTVEDRCAQKRFDVGIRDGFLAYVSVVSADKVKPNEWAEKWYLTGMSTFAKLIDISLL